MITMLKSELPNTYEKKIQRLGEYLIKNAEDISKGCTDGSALKFVVVIDKEGAHITLTKSIEI